MLTEVICTADFLKASVLLNCSPSATRLGNSNYHQLLPSGSTLRYFCVRVHYKNNFHITSCFHFSSFLILSLCYRHYYTHAALKQKRLLNKSTQPFPTASIFSCRPVGTIGRMLNAKAPAGRPATGNTGDSRAFHGPVSPPSSNNSLQPHARTTGTTSTRVCLISSKFFISCKEIRKVLLY